MTTQVIADTSGLYALVDRNDPNHGRAAGFLKSLAGARVPGDRATGRRAPGRSQQQASASSPGVPTSRLLVSNHVYDEVMTLAKVRLGVHVAMQLGLRLRNSRFIELVIFTNAEEQATWRIFSRHTDKEWSYTDCACLALARQRGLQQAFAFDHHFTQMGLVLVP